MAAKSYKTHDPQSPDPNSLELIPTDALVDEILRRTDHALLAYEMGGYIYTRWQRGGTIPAIGLAEYARSKALASIK